MLGHLFTDLAQSILAGTVLAMLLLDLLSFVASIVVVMTFTNLFRVFGRNRVIQLVFCHDVSPFKVEGLEDNARCCQSRIQPAGL
jgi:hypothetical protein